MAYIPKQKRVVRNDFRKEFPQLCAATERVSKPLDFSIITDVAEPVRVVAEGLPHGWINLRYPSTYVHPRPSVHERACEVILNMKASWMKWDREHGHYASYECEDAYDYENDSVSESSISSDDEYDYEIE